jgi:hypothetical protein
MGTDGCGAAETVAAVNPASPDVTTGLGGNGSEAGGGGSDEDAGTTAGPMPGPIALGSCL